MLPLSAASFPSTFAVQSTQSTHIDLLTPDNYRVVVKLNSTNIDHYCTLTLKALHDQVASYIYTFTDPNIASIQVAAVKQLRFRNLAIYT